MASCKTHGHLRGPGDFCIFCRAPLPVARIETHELIETVRRIAREQPLYRTETILHLNLAAAELERLAYPSTHAAPASALNREGEHG